MAVLTSQALRARMVELLKAALRIKRQPGTTPLGDKDTLETFDCETDEAAFDE